MVSRRLGVLCCIWLFSSIAIAQDGGEMQPSRSSSNDIQSRIASITSVLDQLDEYVTLSERRSLLDQADVAINSFKSDFPRNPYIPYLKGRMLSAAGRPREAASNLQTFVETREGRNDWEAHLLIGDLLVNDYPRLANSYYSRADELRPLDPDIRFGMARATAQFGKREDAIRIVRELIASDATDNAKLRTFLAQILLNEQSWEEAEQAAVDALGSLRREVQTYPEAVEPLVGISDMLAVRIQSRRALMALSESTAEDSVVVAQLLRERVANQRIISLLEPLGVLEDAMEVANDNGDVIPDSLRLAFVDLLIEINRKERAKSELNKILAVNPDHAEARRFMEILGGKLPAAGGTEKTETDTQP